MSAVDVDRALVERAQQGDTRAFEMLVVRYQRRIERLISRMVRDADLVQDVAQETFIRAYRALPQFRGESAFYTWLYRIAVNTAKKALVEMKRDPVLTESARSRVAEDDETYRVDHELSDGETPEALITAADLALYRAKNAGRSTFRLFEPEMAAEASQRRCLERDLRAALERDELELFYQPLIYLLRQLATGL